MAAGRQETGNASKVIGGNSAAPRQLDGFGSNPGELRMLAHVPKNRYGAPALVVALHGCGQTAAEYAHGSGWSALADRNGFIVIYPEQQPANNPKTCFSWFLPGDIARDQGEALSIRQMVEHAIVTFGADRRRVFVTGLSAGGAMTSVMLAAYPETFAGGAVIAGLPYGCAGSVQDALAAMFTDKSHPAGMLGARVREATSHAGPWPRLSVWHGSADQVVKPSNADHVIAQWIDVHGLAPTPSTTRLLGPHRHRVWHDQTGNPVIEAYSIADMAHGVPIDGSIRPDGSAGAGPFFHDVGLSSTHMIAQGWGVADADYHPMPKTVPDAVRNLYANPGMPLGMAVRGFADLPRDPSETITAAFKAAGLPTAADVANTPATIVDAALKAAGLKR